ncbi:MAG: hypothetical protein H6745_15335 [Deltaproteobacteria bacterium]|nr:hypothetical protein [Deltaproteobacteria bacterium]
MILRPFAVVAASLVLLAACKSEPAPPPAPTQEQEPAPSEPTAAPPEAADAGGSAATAAPEADAGAVAAAPEPDTAAPTLDDAPRRSITADTVCVALSGDAAYVGAGDLGGRVLAWSLAKSNRMLLQDSTPEGNRIGLVAFARNTPTLVSGAFTNPDAPLRIWQMAPAMQQKSLGEAGLEARDVSISDDARLVAAAVVGEDLVQRVVLFEIGSGEAKLEARLPGAEQARVALAGGGTRLVAADDKGTLHVWDATEDWKEVLSRPVEGAAVKLDRLVLAADGKTLWAAGGAQVYRIDLQDLAAPSLVAVKTLGAGDRDDQVSGLTRLDDDRIVAVTRPRAGGLRLYDGDSGELLATLETGCRCEADAVATAGTLVACDCGSPSEIRFVPLSLPLNEKAAPPEPPPAVDADAGIGAGEADAGAAAPTPEADAGSAAPTPEADGDATAPAPAPDAGP